MNKQLYSECLYEGEGSTPSVTKTELYEFVIDNNEPDPDTKVKYINGTTNYSPAFMDFDRDEFNYGDWKNAFFMNVKPCMLNYNGTVDYYLDSNNYAMREDGETPSDISDPEYPGNVMIEFPKIYWKIVDNGNGTGTVSICNKKLDKDFVCWSNIDNNGKVIDHFYISTYDGISINNKLRSLSEQVPTVNTTRTQEVDYAKANNLESEKIIWYTWVYCDIALLRLLCLLISKSTNSQEKFGYGNNDSYIDGSNTGMKNSGTLNDKGLFYGKNDNTTCVKIFGIENLWGNLWKPVAGWVNDRGTQKVKMTYGQLDESTTDGYNFDGEGYIIIDESTPTGITKEYITSVKITPFGLIPYAASGGSATTHYCDGLYFNNGQTNYALISSNSPYKSLVGIFVSALDGAVSHKTGTLGSALSCKPLAS